MRMSLDTKEDVIYIEEMLPLNKRVRRAGVIKEGNQKLQIEILVKRRTDRMKI